MAFAHVDLVDKREAIDVVNSQVNRRIEMIGYRDNLHLTKSADRLAAQAKALAEDRTLYDRYRAANTVLVGKVSLTD